MSDLTAAILFIAATVVVFLPAFWVSYAYVGRRNRALRESAARLGLFFGENPYHELQPFKLLPSQRHGDRHFTKAIHGEVDGVSVKIFDYLYYDQGSRFAETVTLLSSRHSRLPAFQLYPEGVLQKIGSAFGVQDINFHSHPRFSDAYVLKGLDEPAIRESFTDKVLDYLQKNTGLHVEASGDRMIYSRDDVLVEPEDMRAFLDEALTLFRLFHRQDAGEGAGEIPPRGRSDRVAS